MRAIIILLGLLPCLFADDTLRRAERLYQQADYKASLALLSDVSKHFAESQGLAGKNWYMLGDYKRASDAFYQALTLEPANSEYAHLLGRSYGRRAETASILTAGAYAAKARQFFEEAVKLGPSNDQALNDLFDYYLEAPGFLGGGYDKAEQIAMRIAQRNPAEGHLAAAKLADRRKQFDTTEEHLRRAIQLTNRQVGRVLDLTERPGKGDRHPESEAAIGENEELAPQSPNIQVR